jgi:alpha-L-arabinofuranosidase
VKAEGEQEADMAVARRGLLAGWSAVAAGPEPDDGGAAGASAPAAAAPSGSIRFDPTPLFQISPLLHMQFMEPLGVTDTGVEAAWDHDADGWRPDFVEAVRGLAPKAIRWGGLMSRYYKWREGVGPPAARPPMRNHVWGGWEANRVGTAELVDLCWRVGAEPLLCVNFMGDGHRRYARTREGDRTGSAAEAADWVSYCNDPGDADRRRHGDAAPYGVRLWQIGNETSYGDGGFTQREAIAQTAAFARAMRARDPSIRLIGWGDRGLDPASPLWATDMLRGAGEHLDYIAIHMMQQLPIRPDTLLHGARYQRDPARAWGELMEMSGRIGARLDEVEAAIAAAGTGTKIAVTEGHLSLAPHNTNPILMEWLTGVYHARALNTYQRHGERVAIATAADFNGTRWTVAAVRLQVPRGVSYLTPAGSVMRLFGRHVGDRAVAIDGAPSDLDIAASRAGNKVYLHVACTRYQGSVRATFEVQGARIAAGRVFEIAPDDLRQAVSQDEPEVFAPKERAIDPQRAPPDWRFPAGSVSVVELDLA